MNIMQIFGFVGKDVERKDMPKGGVLYSLSVGVKSKKNKEEVTHWYRVNMWGETRWEKLVPHLKKGSGVIVMGEFFPSQYNNKEGEVIMNLEITADSIRFSPFGKPENKEAKPSTQPNPNYPQNGQPSQGTTTKKAQNTQPDYQEDDLPF